MPAAADWLTSGLWTVLLSTHAFRQLEAVLRRRGSARVAWQWVAPMLAAAGLEPAPPATQLESLPSSTDVSVGAPLLRVVGFRYTPPGRNEALMRDCVLSSGAGPNP